MAELSHSVISPMSFRVEYKRNGTGPAMFQRHVRFQVIIIHLRHPPTKRTILSCHNIETNRNNIVPFQVDLSAICKQEEVSETLFAITFTLLSGKKVLKLFFHLYFHFHHNSSTLFVCA